MKAAKFRYLFQFSPWAALVHPLPPRWTTLLRPVAAALSTVADDNPVVGRSVGRGGAPFAALCFNPGAGPLWMCSIQNLQKIKFCQPTTATATRSRPDGTGPAAFVGCCQHLAFGFAWHIMVLFSRDVESRVRPQFRLDCNEWIMENEVDYCHRQMVSCAVLWFICSNYLITIFYTSPPNSLTQNQIIIASQKSIRKPFFPLTLWTFFLVRKSNHAANSSQPVCEKDNCGQEPGPSLKA